MEKYNAASEFQIENFIVNISLKIKNSINKLNNLKESDMDSVSEIRSEIKKFEVYLMTACKIFSEQVKGNNLPSRAYQTVQFILFAYDYITKIEKELDEAINENDFAKIKKTCDETKRMMVKVSHSFDVAMDGYDDGVILNLFNQSNLELLWTDHLLHDVGRFPQMYDTRTFIDAISFTKNGKSIYRNVFDHGELGEVLLINDNLINKFIPNTRIYDGFIGEVVGLHATSETHPERYNFARIDSNNQTFRQYDIKEIFTSSKLSGERELLKGWHIRILQDVDKFDVLKQVARKDSTPLLSDDPKDDIPKQVYEMFYNGEFLNITTLSQNKLWTCNVGQLVRFSFIYNFYLVATVIKTEKSGLIDQIWKEHPVKTCEPGYEHIKKLMEALISTSPDGIHVDKRLAMEKVRR